MVRFPNGTYRHWEEAKLTPMVCKIYDTIGVNLGGITPQYRVMAGSVSEPNRFCVKMFHKGFRGSSGAVRKPLLPLLGGS